MTNEKMIRELLRKKYLDKFGGVIRDEFTGPNLKTRNDLFLVSDRIVISFEIKSDGDTLKRLRAQVTEYQTYSSLIVIAIDKKHLKKLERDYIDLLTDNVIVEVYDNSKNIGEYLYVHKKGIPDKYPDLFKLLWSSELLLFRQKLKGASKLKLSSKASKSMIINTFGKSTIDTITKYLFIKRLNEDTSRRIRYKPSLIDNNIQTLILEGQEEFNNYLDSAPRSYLKRK